MLFRLPKFWLMITCNLYYRLLDKVFLRESCLSAAKSTKYTPWLGFFIFILSFFPNFGFALGFGNIQLFSYLNEPLDAEIELLGAEDTDPSQWIASLGSAEDFKKAQLSRPYFLNKLRFTVIQQSQPKCMLIRVSSLEAVKQPFLEFLVVLTSSDGRLIRDYTVLLDPAPLGGAARRKGKASKSDLSVTSTTDIKAVQAFQKNYAENLVLNKAVQLAKAEEGIATDAKLFSSKNVQKFSPLFEPEPEQSNLRSIEPSEPSIEKSTAVSVSIESQESQELQGSQELESSASESAAPLIDTDTPLTPSIPLSSAAGSDENSELQLSSEKQADVKLSLSTFYKNNALLGSGLLLLLAVSGTLWIFKRARASIAIVPESITTNLEEDEPDIEQEMDLKLKLATHYLAIQDINSAEEILNDVLTRGNIEEQKLAQALSNAISNIPNLPKT